eukprot:c20185_g1_i1 orf=258-1892(+)
MLNCHGLSLCTSPILSVKQFIPPYMLHLHCQTSSSSTILRSREVQTMPSKKVPHVLTVAGSDSGAGAGIQGDLKACAALGVYCSTVITAVTAQNTVGVQGIHLVPEDFVVKQMESILSDMDVDVVKTGMLPSIGIIHALSSVLKIHPVRALVVDPVMVATSGDELVDPAICTTLCEELLPMANIVTPNMSEASCLLGGVPVNTISDMRQASKAIHRFGPRYVLVKGGHMQGSDEIIDVLYDGAAFLELRAARVQTHNTHGTGCTMASSIAAEIAKGSEVPLAVQAAKTYVQEALQRSTKLSIGKGPQGPLNHLFKLVDWDLISTKAQFQPSSLLLYAVTDSNMNRKWCRSTSEAVRDAIEGGATIVQLREKGAESGEFLKEALACVKVAHEYGVPLLINDRLDIAMACNADGVHLGQCDVPVKHARDLLGSQKIIGASCRTPEEVKEAWKDGADYVGAGSVYPSTTKKDNMTIGLNGLWSVCEESPLPVVAIGGINMINVAEVMQARLPNLYGVAVVSALFDVPNVSAATHELRSILTNSIYLE